MEFFDHYEVWVKYDITTIKGGNKRLSYVYCSGAKCFKPPASVKYKKILLWRDAVQAYGKVKAMIEQQYKNLRHTGDRRW